MKTRFCIIIAMAALASCNNNEKEQKLQALAQQDSILLTQAQKKDSTITSDINAITEIQDNLDSIKRREKILSVNESEYKPGTKQSLMADIKSIDDFILNNDRKLNELQKKVKSLGRKDLKLEKVVQNLNRELAEKDSDIAVLQNRLSKADDSLKMITGRFNDSIEVIKRQRAEVYALSDELNTVYYVTGTLKQLMDKGAVNKEGGFIGLGRSAELNPNLVNSSFTKSNKSALLSIPLNGKFRRLITEHPDKSYSIVHKGTTDELDITNPSDFWKRK